MGGEKGKQVPPDITVQGWAYHLLEEIKIRDGFYGNKATDKWPPPTPSSSQKSRTKEGFQKRQLPNPRSDIHQFPLRKLLPGEWNLFAETILSPYGHTLLEPRIKAIT